MIFASYGMIKRIKNNSSEKIQFNYPLVITEGYTYRCTYRPYWCRRRILIIPALVNFMKLSMKRQSEHLW